MSAALLNETKPQATVEFSNSRWHNNLAKTIYMKSELSHYVCSVA